MTAFFIANGIDRNVVFPLSESPGNRLMRGLSERGKTEGGIEEMGKSEFEKSACIIIQSGCPRFFALRHEKPMDGGRGTAKIACLMGIIAG